MSADLELARWRRQWQEESFAPPLDIRARVARDTRRKRLALAGPLLVTVVVGGAAAGRAGSGEAADLVLAGATWFFIAAAWMIALWLSRGTWRPLSESTAAFVDLSVRRCRGNLRAVPFAGALYLTELTFLLTWFAIYRPDDPSVWLTSWPMIALVWIGGPAFAAFLIRFSRRTRVELQYWLALQRQLAGAPERAGSG